ncbi:hypothetical protein LCGC14_0355410 [marine sediment metagenome]|uniref:Uncharacterized protein n=1 Tax=marine sediment metagenome TaxID=412755 RepID=A0A0F9VWZ0_9ZZZZ
MMNRRTFLISATAALAVPLVPVPSWAEGPNVHPECMLSLYDVVIVGNDGLIRHCKAYEPIWGVVHGFHKGRPLILTSLDPPLCFPLHSASETERLLPFNLGKRGSGCWRPAKDSN